MGKAKHLLLALGLLIRLVAGRLARRPEELERLARVNQLLDLD